MLIIEIALGIVLGVFLLYAWPIILLGLGILVLVLYVHAQAPQVGDIRTITGVKGNQIEQMYRSDDQWHEYRPINENEYWLAGSDQVNDCRDNSDPNHPRGCPWHKFVRGADGQWHDQLPG
jgi:hypothetical protein